MTDTNITIYLSTCCPWCRRVLAVLKEVGAHYEVVSIDLTLPRPEWYLKINPKGQVPTLLYDGKILTESGVIAQFLADLYPSHLVKPSNAPGGALQRAEYALFVSKFLEVVQKPVMGGIFANKGVLAEEAQEMVAAMARSLEPELKTAGPFFGGSETFTLVEVSFFSFLFFFF
ncbi:hypothetical protein TD95_005478, partial [Thielaviopsis punctulata]